MRGAPCIQIEEVTHFLYAALNTDTNSAAGRQAFACPADNGSLAPAMTLPYSVLNLKDSFTVTH